MNRLLFIIPLILLVSCDDGMSYSAAYYSILFYIFISLSLFYLSLSKLYKKILHKFEEISLALVQLRLQILSVNAKYTNLDELVDKILDLEYMTSGSKRKSSLNLNIFNSFYVSENKPIVISNSYGEVKKHLSNFLENKKEKDEALFFIPDIPKGVKYYNACVIRNEKEHVLINFMGYEFKEKDKPFLGEVETFKIKR